MKLFVIGSGGREHALVWRLAQSPHPTKIWSAPGNPGISDERLESNGMPVENVPIGAEDLSLLLDFANEKKPDLTVVGPDNPLGMGIVDLFQEHGHKIWGPNKNAARFEASKAFSQEFMEKYDIPAPKAGVFTNPGPAGEFAASLEGHCAVKADGLALGKGVIVCTNQQEADRAINDMLVNGILGEAGKKIVVQELLEGVEASLHVLSDGESWRLFPASQDHKRAYDGDTGPNTGGMGAYAPASFLRNSELLETASAIIEPWINGCKEEGIDYRGILYPGIMLTDNGARVLEFNSRFGDPETQVYMPLLENDLVELLSACTEKNLKGIELKFNDAACVCVVKASGGYPGKYTKGKTIYGLEDTHQIPGVKVFHAGTSIQGNNLVTNGGRVLGITAWADTLSDAREKAYAAAARIQFEGELMRTDIGKKASI
ncbi:MAG: phosphoribosylamine--glycine ligase [Verrucomicrobia bacterium]|nr:phosphoribosylamine--glycine ligase [Verrucomicrobiota bacterium]